MAEVGEDSSGSGDSDEDVSVSTEPVISPWTNYKVWFALYGQRPPRANAATLKDVAAKVGWAAEEGLLRIIRPTGASDGTAAPSAGAGVLWSDGAHVAAKDDGATLKDVATATLKENDVEVQAFSSEALQDAQPSTVESTSEGPVKDL